MKSCVWNFSKSAILAWVWNKPSIDWISNETLRHLYFYTDDSRSSQVPIRLVLHLSSIWILLAFCVLLLINEFQTKSRWCTRRIDTRLELESSEKHKWREVAFEIQPIEALYQTPTSNRTLHFESLEICFDLEILKILVY